MSTTSVWRGLLRYLLALGEEVAPASTGGDWRGRTTKEILGHQTIVPMGCPIVRCPGRKLGHRFLAAEAAWIASGRNDLASIVTYARQMKQFSDDGLTLAGAYGPPFIDQLGWVVRTLAADPASRQAVATIWRPRPGPSKDTPCTVALQWLIRGRRLHCVATMRSSDAWTGWVYDVHSFSTMSAVVVLALREYQKAHPPELHIALEKIDLGNLILTVGSQHLYRLDWDAAQACADRDDELPPVAPLDLDEFTGPAELTDYLWAHARGEVHGAKRWVQELLT